MPSLSVSSGPPPPPPKKKIKEETLHGPFDSYLSLENCCVDMSWLYVLVCMKHCQKKYKNLFERTALVNMCINLIAHCFASYT